MAGTSFEELIKKAKDGMNSEWLYNSCINVKAPKLEDVDECRDFIKNYFSEAGKAFPRSMLSKIKDNKRIKHIVSSFFLGIGIYQESSVLKAIIDMELKRYDYALKHYHSKAPFAYVWFLICLCHDLGYAYEEKGTNLKFKKFEDLTKHFGNLGMCEGVPELYASMIEPYFKYRAEGMGLGQDKAVNDHGIVGAFHLYHDLCRTRAEKRKEVESDPQSSNKWVKELDDIYNLVAWIVGCHNIFFTNTDKFCDMFKYMWFHLFGLIKEPGDYKISLYDNPLFFFLQLIDNIEPIKMSSDGDDKCMSEIKIKIDDKRKFLHIERVDKKPLDEWYYNRLLGINNWLTKVEGDKLSCKIYYTNK